MGFKNVDVASDDKIMYFTMYPPRRTCSGGKIMNTVHPPYTCHVKCIDCHRFEVEEFCCRRATNQNHLGKYPFLKSVLVCYSFSGIAATRLGYRLSARHEKAKDEISN